MQVKPIADHLANTVLGMAQEREQILQQVIQQYNEMLVMLQQLKKGEIELGRLIVTDDGWKLMPEAPQSNGKGSAKEAKEATKVT